MRGDRTDYFISGAGPTRVCRAIHLRAAQTLKTWKAVVILCSDFVGFALMSWIVNGPLSARI